MSFTEAQLLAQLQTDGAGAAITRFNTTIDGTVTDVYVQNLNSTTSEKSGLVQVAQSNTAAEAATLIRTTLTAK